MKIILPGLIVFALWSFLCVRWYVCGIHELCDETTPAFENDTEQPLEVTDSEVDTEERIEAPLTFEWSGAAPLLGNTFEFYLDSMALWFSSEPASVVQITGLYDPQEINNSTYENLGLARAQAVKELLLDRGIKRSININSRPEDLSSGLGDRISNGIAFSLDASIPDDGFTISRNAQKLVIHFPSDSENPRSDQQVVAAVRALAREALQQNRSVLVIGHTDSQGDAQENKVLGLIRATKVKELLIESGMAEKEVLAESEGEEAPIARNNSIAGRQLNRRVELVII